MCHFLVDQCPTGGPFQQWQYKNTWQDELVCRHPLVAMAPCHHWALTNGLGRLYLSLCWPWFSHTPAPDKNLQWGSKNTIFSTWPFPYQNGGQCYNENPHCLYFPLKLGSVSEAAKYFTFFSLRLMTFKRLLHQHLCYISKTITKGELLKKSYCILLLKRFIIKKGWHTNYWTLFENRYCSSFHFLEPECPLSPRPKASWGRCPKAAIPVVAKVAVVVGVAPVVLLLGPEQFAICNLSNLNVYLKRNALVWILNLRASSALLIIIIMIIINYNYNYH